MPLLLAWVGSDGRRRGRSADDSAPVPDRVFVECDDRRFEVPVEPGAGAESRPCSHRNRPLDLTLALERIAFDTTLDSRVGPDPQVAETANAAADPTLDPGRTDDRNLSIEGATVRNEGTGVRRLPGGALRVALFAPGSRCLDVVAVQGFRLDHDHVRTPEYLLA